MMNDRERYLMQKVIEAQAEIIATQDKTITTMRESSDLKDKIIAALEAALEKARAPRL